jgi:hypothetical protein
MSERVRGEERATDLCPRDVLLVVLNTSSPRKRKVHGSDAVRRPSLIPVDGNTPVKLPVL